MQTAQHETGMTLNIGVVNRFNESVRRIKRAIDEGRLGDVYHDVPSGRTAASPAWAVTSPPRLLPAAALSTGACTTWIS